MTFYVVSAKNNSGNEENIAFPNFEDVCSLFESDASFDEDSTNETIKEFLNNGYTISISFVNSPLISDESELQYIIVTNSSKLKDDFIQSMYSTNACNTNGKINCAVNLMTEFLNGGIDQDSFSMRYYLLMFEFLNKPKKFHDNISLHKEIIYTTRSRLDQMNSVACRTYTRLEKECPEAFKKFVKHLLDSDVIDENGNIRK